MKVLANDGLEISAINEIKKNGISIETNHLDKEALIENIKDYDVLVVRSATKDYKRGFWRQEQKET